METITVYRTDTEGQESAICLLAPDHATLTREIMGKDEVSVRVTVAEKLPVRVGDYIKIDRVVKNLPAEPMTPGIKYMLNREPRFVKKSEVEFEYDLMFEAPVYRLMDKQFLSVQTRQSSFTIAGTLSDFVEFIVRNVNRSGENPEGVDTGWSTGIVPETEKRVLAFENTPCWNVLAQLAATFNAEYDVVDKTIHFYDRFETDTDYEFEQGQGRGLYSVEQNNLDTSNTITRAYLFGGTKNLPPKRTVNGVEIPPYRNGEERLRLDERYLEAPVSESNYDKIVEGAVIFDDIYPSFEGTAESVTENSSKEYVIASSNIDFNTADWLIGTSPMVNFLSGDLEGRAFRCSTNATAKTLTIAADDSEVIRREAGNISIGDRFTITDICMPDSYVAEAEARLRTEGERWFGRYNRLRVQYTLTVDNRFLKQSGWSLAPGDIVSLRIPELFAETDNEGATRPLRITAITTDLLDESLSCTVSNHLRESWEQKIEGQLRESKMTVILGKNELLEASKAWTARNFARLNGGNAFSGDQVSSDFRTGVIDGAGWGLLRVQEGQSDSSVLEVDKLIVRREAHFNEVVINQVSYMGGKQICSAAAMVCTKVTEFPNAYRCHFDTKKEQVQNLFAVNDQAYCQRFDPASLSIVKYYWRLVTGTGTDYIDLSKTDKDGSGIPMAGDNIVQLGNRNIAARQSAIVTDVIGGGRMTFLDGISGYSLSQKEVVTIGKVNGVTKLVVGEENNGGRLEYDNSTKTLSIKGKLEILGDSKGLENLAEWSEKNNTITGLLGSVTDLQNQIDGKVEAFFYETDALLTNPPANSWTTNEIKEQHIGDTYTNLKTGASWRWTKSGSSYSWVEITDTATLKALADANAAMKLAEKKKQVFSTQPTTPYDVGDLWVMGSTGDIKYCKTARTDTERYYAGDWEKASKYTDDTTAFSVQSKLDGFLTTYLPVNYAQGINFTYAQSEIPNDTNIVKNLCSVYDGVVGKTAYYSVKCRMTGGSSAPSGTMIVQLRYKNSSGSDIYTYIRTVTLGSELTNNGATKLFGGTYTIPAGSSDPLLQLRFDNVSGFTNGTLQVWDTCCTLGNSAPDLVAPSPLDYKTAMAEEEAKRQTFDYLKEAIGGKTEIEGGLFTCKLLGIRGDNDTIVGGFASKGLALWAGGTLQDAEADSAKFIVKNTGEVQQDGNLTIRKNGEIRILNEDSANNLSTTISGKQIAELSALTGSGSVTGATYWSARSVVYTLTSKGTGSWEVKMASPEYTVTGSYVEINPSTVVRPTFTSECTTREQIPPLGPPTHPATFTFSKQEIQDVNFSYEYRLNIYKATTLNRYVILPVSSTSTTPQLLYSRIDMQTGENRVGIALVVRYNYPTYRQTYRAYYQGRDWYEFRNVPATKLTLTAPALSSRQLVSNAVFKGSQLGINGYCLSAGKNDYFRIGMNTKLADNKRTQLSFRGDISVNSNIPNQLLSGTVYMAGSGSLFWNKAGYLKDSTLLSLSAVMEGSTPKNGYIKVTHNANKANIVLATLYDERNTTDAYYMPLSIMVTQRDANSFIVRTYHGDNARSNGKFAFIIIGV